MNRFVSIGAVVAALFTSTFSAASSIRCEEDKPHGIRFVMLTNIGLAKSNQAAYVELKDIPDEFPSLMGATSVKTSRTGAQEFVFSDTKTIDWTKVDPIHCYVTRTDRVLTIARNATDTRGAYLGTLEFKPAPVVRPGAKCELPASIRPEPTAHVVCDEFRSGL